MKAIVRDRYGLPDVLEVRDIEVPVPKDGEVLVRVHASSVTIGDWYWLTGRPLLIRLGGGPLAPKDRVLGRDVAGRVEAVGTGVTRLAPGDEVYGEVGFGAHAEFVAAREDILARKPANLSFEEAAAVPIAGVTALQGLRDCGHVQAGQRVLVNGASGAVGTMAVQVAKAFGAEVTGVCSTRNLALVRSLGADHVIDYTKEDFTSGERRYDLIFDLAGSKPISSCRRLLTPQGVYVSSVGRLSWVVKAALASQVWRGRVAVLVAKESRSDLDELRGLIEAGTLRPVIDGRYSLEEVPEAFRRQGSGHAQGRKVISIAAL